MALSNGYNRATVLAALKTRIGWKQDTNTKYAILDDDNQTSDSGKYYNGNSYHASLTIPNILDCQPDEGLLSNPDLANTYLSELIEDNALSALDTVFNAGSTPLFIESGLTLEKEEYSAKQLETNGTRFVGQRFKLAEGYSLTLNNVTLLLDSAVTFKVYLYHEFLGKVNEWSVTTVANKQTIKAIDYTITSNSSTVKDGMYFLGYYQEDLGSAKAITFASEVEDYKTFDVTPFESVASGTTSFNMVTYSETYKSYGLNAEVTAYRDLTAAIVSNAHLFDNLLGYMMVVKCIDIITNSTRSNRTQRISDANVNWLIRQKDGYMNGENGFVKGIVHRVNAEAKQVRDAFLGKSKNTVVSCYS